MNYSYALSNLILIFRSLPGAALSDDFMSELSEETREILQQNNKKQNV